MLYASFSNLRNIFYLEYTTNPTLLNLYSSLESYVNSQKKTCLYFLMLGFVLLGFAAYSYFFSYSDPFYQGLFLGSVSAGILIILGGLTYGRLNNKILGSKYLKTCNWQE